MTEFEKVESLLTPKHQRNVDFKFNERRGSAGKIFWKIGGIAAMLALVVTVALSSIFPASASQKINAGMENLFNAETVKVEFTLRCMPVSGDEVYAPHPSGEILDGTLYVLNTGTQVCNRIDWHDKDNNTIIFKDKEYVHLRDGELVERHSCNPVNEFAGIFNLKSLRKQLGTIMDDADITTKGEYIYLVHNKGKIALSGKFRKDNNMLVEATASYVDPQGCEVSLLKTNSIHAGVNLPEGLFDK